MRNRTALTKIIVDLDELDARLRPISASASSAAAFILVDQARASVRAAKSYLAGALDHPLDPILDLTMAAAS